MTKTFDLQEIVDKWFEHAKDNYFTNYFGFGDVRFAICEAENASLTDEQILFLKKLHDTDASDADIIAILDSWYDDVADRMVAEATYGN